MNLITKCRLFHWCLTTSMFKYIYVQLDIYVQVHLCPATYLCSSISMSSYISTFKYMGILEQPTDHIVFIVAHFKFLRS